MVKYINYLFGKYNVAKMLNEYFFADLMMKLVNVPI